MRDDQHRAAILPQFGDKLPEALVGLPIESLIGFVQEQQTRPVHERQRQIEFLFCATAQVTDEFGAVVFIAEQLDEFVGSPQAPDVVRGAEVVEVLVYAQSIVQDDLLGTISHRAAAQHLAAARSHIARENAQQSGFSRAVLADDTYECAGGDCKAAPLSTLWRPYDL